MKRGANFAGRFDYEFENYLRVTEVLRTDMTAMMHEESKSLHWRRNFVRASAALLECHAECLSSLCAIGIALNAVVITKKENGAILNPGGTSANERLKLTLRVAYRLFDLHPVPQFGGPDWKNAQRVMSKRHRLMHPKRPRDLGIADATWRNLRRGIIWLMKCFFDFLSLAQARYGA